MDYLEKEKLRLEAGISLPMQGVDHLITSYGAADLHEDLALFLKADQYPSKGTSIRA